MASYQIGPDSWHFEASVELTYPVTFGQKTEVFFPGDPKGESVYSAWPREAYRADGTRLDYEDLISDAEIIRYLIPFEYSSGWLLENGLAPGFKLGLIMLGALRNPFSDPLGWLHVVRLNPEWHEDEPRTERRHRRRRLRSE